MDFATATIVVIAQYILGKLAADVDRRDGWVIRSVKALKGQIDNTFLADLARQIDAWDDQRTFPFPLSEKQFAAAQRVLRHYAATLARIARDNARAKVGLPPAPPEATQTPPEATPEAMPDRPPAIGPRLPRKPRKPRKAPGKKIGLPPIDPTAPAPWEIDDAAHKEVCRC